MRNLGPVLADSWRLFKPYFFRSEERKSALAMLVGVAILSVAQTELGVLSTFWYNLFYDALQTKNLHAFTSLLFTWYPLKSGWVMPGLLGIGLLQILIGCLSVFVTQYLQIRWRRWMTGDYLRRWLSQRAYYRISVASDREGVATDNPDQRISDDLASFCGAGANSRPGSDTLTLLLGLMSNIVSLFSYVILLWVLSKGIPLFGRQVPGSLIWVALAFSIGSTLLTYFIGRKLIRLRFFQQRYEADFRFGLVRARENTEGIALHGGERDERDALLASFASIRTNFMGLLRRFLLLNVFTITYGQVAVLLPFLLIGPMYFAGRATLGLMMQTAQAFQSVQDSFSWFATNFPELAIWRATVGRLATFDRAVEEARAAEGKGFVVGASGDGYRLDGLTLGLPGGAALGQPISMSFAKGVDTVITGRSGVGKSTLFRVLAGIWPFGSGRVERAAGRSLFLPQKPYIPLGTLRRAVCYPLAESEVAAGVVETALVDADLPQLLTELDVIDENWALRLSGGEQQRLAIARALVVRPDWLFLDEATASLDPETETRMYAVLKRRLPETTIISIAHNPAVAAFHDRKLVLGGQGALIAAE